MTENKVCYVCGATLGSSKSKIVLSYWKVSCTDDNWFIYICNTCNIENIEFPCNKKELMWLKIRASERSKFH